MADRLGLNGNVILRQAVETQVKRLGVQVYLNAKATEISLDGVIVSGVNETAVLPADRWCTHSIVMSCCRRKNIRPNINFKVGEILTIHRLVSAGQGVGISVESVAEDLALSNVRAILFRDSRMIWSAYLGKRRGVALSAAARTFERYTANWYNVNSVDT